VAIRRVWDEIVATVGRRSKRAAAVVREASVREVDGDTIVLLFQHTVHATMLAGAPQPLLDAVHQVFGGSWQVRCEARDTARPAAPASVPPAPSRGTAGPDWPEPARPGGSAGDPASSAGDPAPPATDPDPAGHHEIDEVADPRTPPASGEQQAMELLRQSLGAEKIGEVAP
jgi:DNA polymerase-3 subunit gamma/tau